MILRAAQPEDYGHFARLYPELGVEDPLPNPQLWWQIYGPDTLLLEVDGLVLGYSYGQVLGISGYVRHLVIDPSARGRGYARALMHSLRQHFVERGCLDWRLNVKVDNHAAIELYRTCGMSVEYLSWVLRIPRQTPVLPTNHPRRLVRRTVPEEQDAQLEAEFQIPAGLLARHRSRPNTQVQSFYEADACVALAPFDPFFPGCFPLRIPAERHAMEVVAGLLPLVPTEREYLQLVLERDQGSAERLLAVGAKLVFAIQHMSAPLMR